MSFPLVHHNEFYMETVIFLVEDTLFKVQRFPFEGNAVFATVFTLPSGDQATIEGSSDDNPLRLDGILKHEFESFLRALYPSDTTPNHCMSIEEWTSVLKLSTMWDFLDTRALALQNLAKTKMDLVTKVLIAKQYKIHDWLFAGYEALAKRTSPISLSEAERLGLTTTVQLYLIREEGAATIPRKRTTMVSYDGGRTYKQEYTEIGPINRERDDYSQMIEKGFTRDLRDAGGWAEPLQISNPETSFATTKSGSN